MIPNENALLTTEGSLGGREIDMKVDVTNMTHIMNMFTDLYEDSEMAVIREYSTNALDAHRESGNKRPIEITTPGPLGPFFTIQDWGVGLSVNDIEDIYSLYGASTKRNSNNVVGMLGLGCKSALAYTNTFLMVAVKNGVKTTAAIRRREDGTGVIEIVDTCATDEPNGVLIRVPVKDYNTFAAKCADFFRFWEPGTVLVDGKTPGSYKGTKVADGIYYESAYGNQSVVVMGNVPYPIKNFYSYLQSYSSEFRVVAYVPIGSVNFPPDRESLQYDDQTKVCLQDIAQRFEAGLTKAAKAEILAEPDHPGAWAKWKFWLERLPNGALKDMKYKGDLFQAYVSGKHIQFRPNTQYNAVMAGYYDLDIPTFNNAMVIVNYPQEFGYGIKTYQRRKIREYLRQNGRTERHVYLYHGVPKSVWIDQKALVQWSDIVATKLNNPNRLPGGTFFMMDKNDTYGRHDNVIPKGTVLYMSPRDKNVYHPRTVLTHIDHDVTIVYVSMNRWAKFARDHGARELRAYVLDHVRARSAALGTEAVNFNSMESWHKEFFKSLDASKVDDPEIKRYIEIARSGAKNKSDEWRSINSLASAVRVTTPNATGDRSLGKLINRYPLISFDGPADHRPHVYIYLNAAYTKGK